MRRIFLGLSVRRLSKHNKSDYEAQLEKFGEKFTELKENEVLKTLKTSYKDAYKTVVSQNSELAKDIKERADSIMKATSKTINKVGDTIKPLKKPLTDLSEKLEPHVNNIKESEMAKTVSSIASEIDKDLKDNSSYYQYGGVTSKEKRASYEKELAKDVYPSNDKAGGAIIQSDKSGSDRLSGVFRFKFPNLFKFQLPKSNNIFAHTFSEGIGNLVDKVKYLFEESDLAKSIRSAKSQKPSFSLESFISYSREYLIPEFIEGVLCQDVLTTDKLCSEGLSSSLRSAFQNNIQNRLKSHGKVLDIRDVDVVSGKVIDGNPVFVFTCTVHQLSYVVNAEGAIVHGSKDKAEFVRYVFAFVIRDSTYKLIEFSAREKGI